jgi:dTMP kinase
MCPEAELLLFAASRAELARKVIAPALEEDAWVLCDRYLDSSLVYQGFARGLEIETLRQINSFAVERTLPTLTLIFRLDKSQSFARLKNRPGAADRLEQEPMAFHERVAEGYMRLAREEPRRVTVLDGAGTIEEVARRMFKEVERVFEIGLD